MRDIRMWLYLVYLETPLVASLFYADPPVLNLPLLAECIFSLVVTYCLVALSRRFRSASLQWLIAFLPLSSIFLFEVVEALAYYFQGESFNVRFFFHANLDTVKASIGIYPWGALLPLISMVGIGLADWYLCRKFRYQSSRKIWRLALILLLAFVVFPNALKDFSLKYVRYLRPGRQPQMAEVLAELRRYDVRADAFFPQSFAVRAPSHPKNLVVLYLESFEATYLDDAEFPDLLPNLRHAAQSGVELTNLRQYPGTDWTIAGMVASQCGLPLLINLNDSIYQNQALKNLTCLGNILNQAGYYQVYIGGASLDFAGKGIYYRAHGYNEVWGDEELKQSIAPNQRSEWGLYDQAMFDLAAQKFSELSAQAAPFHLTLLTIDSHLKGDASASCPAYPHSTDNILRAVHCTDFLFGRFLEKIQREPSYANTLMLVMSDHLGVREAPGHHYPAERKLLAFALNAGLTGKIDMAGGHFDIPYTLLDLLALRSAASFPLGQSLLQPEQPDRFAIFQHGQERLFGELLALINKQVHGIRICEGEGIYMKNIAQKIISIGGQDVVMTRKGHPKLPEPFLFLVRSDLAGLIQEYQIVSSDEAARIIEKFPNAIYFMLTKESVFPLDLFTPDAQHAIGWKWYLGNPFLSRAKTGVVQDLQQLAIESAACRELIVQQ